jgi:uncharacterized membrane protein
VFNAFSLTQYYETCNSIVTNDILIRVIVIIIIIIIIIIIDGMRLFKLHVQSGSAKDKF